MSEQNESSRILLAHHDHGTRRILESILVDALEHEIVLSTSHGAKLLEAYRKDPPDLVISSVYLEDGEAIEYLVQASKTEPRPSVIVTARDELEHVERALEDHVMSYLVEPVSADDLRPSIYLVLKRFEEFQELREEVQDLNEALRARKVIEQAKGVLMKSKDLDEAAAYKRLQKLASSKRKKLVEIAEALLLSSELQ